MPSKIVELNEFTARVEAYGEHREVSLILMNEPVEVGDYLLIQVGNFAVEKIPPERAVEALEYMATLNNDSELPAHHEPEQPKQVTTL
ncbi:HypC/HybG/HupF family hydrogenase formation chaperone [Aestuariirhabdus sp. Z084]|uniref:HypC/HybG/HupF family hydrogenase formation chaperone n=1 Tax=Aestuariirhabdus haliotis TaxID=2918751 RepID=UPI00201B3E43|nr:HypC/HybG/HupF family hydrogenase formation chaperone [Aestuariirhabdus haliotis]MCL6415151.1 HypC/HybG/HupF family hydrogenase formation chaperone [Aestuariirhabdus haliotis]MCL6420026.1 HypC/HybG/HupF family hydrogenase formation chaperone [Aestuariirhabdus haliotis]